MSIRVLHSFPHKIGAGRICMTAWHEVAGAADAGAAVTVFPTAVARPLPPTVRVQPTLARGRWRLPRRLLGDRALALHDQIVAHRLPELARDIDIVHAWPLGALETLRTARRLGIPTVLERPNAHTRFAYEVVARESKRLGVTLPPDHEHAYNATRLATEEAEYQLADRLLCPSEFVVQTFLDAGFAGSSLTRNTYGYNDSVYYPAEHEPRRKGLNALFVGVCAVRKGVHFALEAWLKSPASRHGKFRIAGEFVPDYQTVLGDMLDHPSVEVLGHSEDVPALMRESDILLLPSIEEGFGLVVVEAMASACVPLVSEGCTEVAEHGLTGLRHEIADVNTLTEQITMLHEDPAQLAALRAGCLAAAPEHTWSMAGVRLRDAYLEVVGDLTGRSELVA